VTGSSQQRIKHLIWNGLSIVQQRSYFATVLEDTRDYFGDSERRTFPSAGTQNLLYTTDHLGNIREVVDKGPGAIRVRYDYTPYGIRSKASGAWNLDSDFGFTGHYTNDRSGLILAPYRALDAKLGRWLSRDLVGEQDGTNLYAYVGNVPLNYVDPSGLVRIAPALRKKFPKVADMIEKMVPDEQDLKCMYNAMPNKAKLTFEDFKNQVLPAFTPGKGPTVDYATIMAGKNPHGTYNPETHDIELSVQLANNVENGAWKSGGLRCVLMHEMTHHAHNITGQPRNRNYEEGFEYEKQRYGREMEPKDFK
jgi:RHS repeat-associated protein